LTSLIESDRFQAALVGNEARKVMAPVTAAGVRLRASAKPIADACCGGQRRRERDRGKTRRATGGCAGHGGSLAGFLSSAICKMGGAVLSKCYFANSRAEWDS